MSKQWKTNRNMTSPISRRRVVGMAPVLPIAIAIADFGVTAAHAQAGPRASVILRGDLAGQDKQVQESMVTIVEFPPTTIAPRHMHPAAQEIFYLIEGNVTVEVDGEAARALKAGDVALISAEVPHVVRNDSTMAAAKAIAVHSRGDKSKPLRIDLKSL